VKVLDFGIAKTTEAEAARERRLTSPGMAMGTPEYMAPEQAAGRPADARCDVYALGAICYEMVTGMPPYSGDNFMEILTKKATQDPVPPATVRAGLPQAISDLVMMAMARNPDSRPQTMETFEYELNKCLAGRGVAVAQILGMTTDPNVVATLNAGLSVRDIEDGAVVPRAQSAPVGVSRATTYSGMSELPSVSSAPVHAATAAAGAAASGQFATSQRLQSEPRPATMQPSGPNVDQVAISQPVIIHKRSALGALGWLLLGALLFGGIGAVIYVAMGERGQRAAKAENPGAQVLDAVQAPDEPQITPPQKPNKVEKDSVLPRDAGSGGSANVQSDDKDKPKPQTNKKQGAKPRVATAAEEKDPKALIKLGAQLEKAGEYDQARGVYMKLQKIKGYAGQALYMQAWAAFQANDNQAAEQLSKAAIEANTPNKIQAQFLYGDALFRKGEYERAKKVYISLRGRTSGENKATATKKIAACNKALKLPDADGITN
jgi:cytochrome c-type biogenesis protein CcmH/NrfG